jgi:hypothetical protein
MILSLGISIHVNNFIGDKYEFDNRYWQLIAMDWETINDTWEEEI